MTAALYDVVLSDQLPNLAARGIHVLGAEASYARQVGVKHPQPDAGDAKAVVRWNAAVKAVVALSMRLRLSPQSRAPNNPTRPGSKSQRELSVYEKMALQEGDHDGVA